jgi:VPDSG-CTERM motif
MKMQFAKRLVAISGMLIVAAIPATAATFQFDDLQGTPNGDDFLPNGADGAGWFKVTGNDVASSNSSLGGSLSYTSGGITVVVTASYKKNGQDYAATVVQDNGSGGIAGLGVYSKYPFNNSDDNITGKLDGRLESLKLDFGRVVQVTDFGFNADGHFSLNNSTETFLLNGVQKAFNSPDSYSGQFFTFTFDSSNTGRQFYLGSVVANIPDPGTTSAVPDGGTTLALLGLSFVGLGAGRRFMFKK